MVILCGLVLGISQLSKLTFVNDPNAYHFIPEETLEQYKNHISEFDNGSSQAIIILEHKTSWTTFEEFQILDKISSEVEAFEPGEQTTSLTQIELPKKNAFGITEAPLIDLTDKVSFKNWETRKDGFQDVHSKFLSPDGKFALLYYARQNLPPSLKVMLRSLPRKEVISNILFFDSNTFGKAIQANATYNLLLTLTLSITFIILAFYWLTRSIKGLLIIMLMIAFNFALVVAIMSLFGMGIGPHVSAIPSLIAVMSFSDIMHIFYQQKQLLNSGQTPKERQKVLRRTLHYPMLFTSLTNVFGFVIYILASTNLYVTHLGVIAFCGVGIAYLSARFLVINLMHEKSDYIDSRILSILTLGYQRIQKTISPYRKHILVIFFLSTSLLFIFAAGFTETGSSNRQFIDETSNISRAQAVLEAQFFGNQKIEIIAINHSGQRVFDYNCLKDLSEVENVIEQQLDPLYLSSPLTVVRRYNRFRINGHSKAFKIPKHVDSNMKTEFNRVKSALGWNEVVNKEENIARFTIGFNEVSPLKRTQIYSALSRITLSLSHRYHYTVTGPSVLQDNGEASFVELVKFGFLMAFILAGIIAGLTVKSLQKALAFILINAFPLCFALTLMALFNIPLNTVSIFMLSILVGLCLDDSIYLITLPKGEKESVAIYPIIVTTVVLACGMLALSFSIYNWLRPFSIIFFASFFVSLLADIFILPLLLNATKAAHIND